MFQLLPLLFMVDGAAGFIVGEAGAQKNRPFLTLLTKSAFQRIQ
jgi:hypothetical protein